MSDPISDADRATDNLRAFLEPEVNQDLVQLLQGVRAFDGTTLMMMQQTKNEWLKRLPIEKMENHYFATMAWLYLQAGPINQVRRTIWTEVLFREAVMAWASEEVEGKPRISSEVLAMADVIIQHELRLIESAHVTVMAKPGDKKAAEPPNS